MLFRISCMTCLADGSYGGHCAEARSQDGSDQQAQRGGRTVRVHIMDEIDPVHRDLVGETGFHRVGDGPKNEQELRRVIH